MRQVTHAPIKYVILTHGHWDHVGGLGAVREPGTTVIARAGFAEELARSRSYHPPFQYFFGTGTMKLDVKPDRLISAPETLSEGGLDLRIIPAPSGETPDALFVQDRKHDLLVVGDAFMPYIGAPFVAEGSPEGFLGAIDLVLQLHPRRLIHGHSPLTARVHHRRHAGLRDAMGALYARSLAAARAARPLADLLHDDFLPASLRAAPAAVQPYLITRDTFVQRLYTEHAGYWQANGDGIDAFTRVEWAGALDALGGGGDAPFVRTARELEARGDAGLALQIAELGLARHPASAALQETRSRALTTLRDIYSQTNPFRFIVYSELAGRGLAPVRADDHRRAIECPNSMAASSRIETPSATSGPRRGRERRTARHGLARVLQRQGVAHHEGGARRLDRPMMSAAPAEALRIRPPGGLIEARWLFRLIRIGHRHIRWLRTATPSRSKPAVGPLEIGSIIPRPKESSVVPSPTMSTIRTYLIAVRSTEPSRTRGELRSAARSNGVP